MNTQIGIYICPKCGEQRPGITPVLDGDAWYLCYCGSRAADGIRMVDSSGQDTRDPKVGASNFSGHSIQDEESQ